jgi:hypothetical protein
MQRDIDNGGDGENAPSRQQTHVVPPIKLMSFLLL